MTTKQQLTKREAERVRLSEPFTNEEINIIKAAQQDFWTFLNTVYAASFEGESFLYADGNFGPFKLGSIHEYWAHRIAGVNRPGGDPPYRRWRIMAPRLHLKSTVLGRGYIFWRFFSDGKDVDALYFGFKKPLAEEHVTFLKEDIEKNPYCRFWVDNNPTATSIVDATVSFREAGKDVVDMSVGEKAREEKKEKGGLTRKTWRAQCEAEGILAATRGRHPKIVMCDDILSDFANPIDSVEVVRINDIFGRSIKSLPTMDGVLGVVGTPQAPNDILHKLENDLTFWCAKFPAVQDYATENVLWPEMYSYKRLMTIKNSITEAAFLVEYQLHPRESIDQFLRTEAIVACLNEGLKRFVPVEGEKFDNPDKLNVWGGMDVGKQVHPSHVSIFVEVPPEKGQDQGWLVQIYEEWLDHMNYNEQVELLNNLIRYFDPIRFYFDNTRSELEDRGLTKRATGFKFKKNVKGSMATLLEKRINNTFYHSTGEGEDPAAGPGIVLYGPEDTRQVRSMKQMHKDLTASENEDGHADAFISTMLAVYGCESGPRIANLGSAQDIFGGQRVGGNKLHRLSCKGDMETFSIPDPLGLRPDTKKQKCRDCGFWMDVPT